MLLLKVFTSYFTKSHNRTSGGSKDRRFLLTCFWFGRNFRTLHDDGATFFVGRRFSATEAFIGTPALAQQLAGFLRIAPIKLRELCERNREDVAMMQLISINVLGGIKPQSVDQSD